MPALFPVTATFICLGEMASEGQETQALRDGREHKREWNRWEVSKHRLEKYH